MASEKTYAEQIQLLPLDEIKPYEDAPFKVRLNENMEELVESVRENGILVPTIARPHPDGGVEMLAGHRRLSMSYLLNQRRHRKISLLMFQKHIGRQVISIPLSV